MEVGKNFDDINLYNVKMARNLGDKLYFTNILPRNNNYLFVDFGCADGTMLNALYDLYNNRGYYSYFIGYDISDSMIELAKEKFHDPSASNILFTTKWDDVSEQMNNLVNYKRVLILSSVIHEVYSYAESEKDIIDFYNKLLNNNFDYICIRDMMPSETIDRESDKQQFSTFIQNVKKNPSLHSMLHEFESINGSTENNKNFIHFLLKYKYVINWNREVHENYFPIYYEDFLKIIESKYSITYLTRFRVPYMDDCIKTDFNVTLNDFTHIKLVLEKK